MADRLDLLWQCSALSSIEHFSLQQTDHTHILSGNVALLVDDIPGHVGYRVTVSKDWLVNHAIVDFEIGARQEVFELTHVDGIWTVNGQERADLAGCTDVDLGWTPATNTIPLRRLATGRAGEQFEIRAAWVRFPELDIQANEQRYTRLTTNQWRYQSGPYDYEFVVSDESLVLEYGDDLWRAQSIVRTAC
jgi:uncharacterized protein